MEAAIRNRLVPEPCLKHRIVIVGGAVVAFTVAAELKQRDGRLDIAIVEAEHVVSQDQAPASTLLVTYAQGGPFDIKQQERGW